MPEETKRETAVLAGIFNASKIAPCATEETMLELAELAKTAGADVAASVLQPRPAPDAATYFGSGKLEELRELCINLEATLIICDDELSGSQLRNIENAVGVRVIDRTTLILDIFAMRALSKEGKLQVELAQLKYMMPRLSGMHEGLSRLGGGIGTRGPGETKLETDKRHIRTRISHLKRELDEVELRRGYARDRRKKDGVLTVALAGYTNAGKSSILNYLTDAGTLAENKLFATLDPLSRVLTLPDDREVILIDTVGFIRKLPHHLVNAFKSTLDEISCADVILNVVDFSNPEHGTHLDVSRDLLCSLGCENTPQITVYNKCDAVEAVPASKGAGEIFVSAKNGTNMEELLKLICINLPQTKVRMTLLIPYANAGLEGQLREDGFIKSADYEADGIKITADIDKKAVYKYEQFKI